jgi:multifunctional cyclase/dehydratase/O-methyltransferase
MVDLTRLEAPAVAVAYPWSGFRTVCDVTGGRGTLLAEILTRHPGLRGMLVEAPEVAAAARGYLADQGLADRVDVLAGNFFEHLPTGADAYILKDILHDWDDTRALAIRTVSGSLDPAARCWWWRWSWSPTAPCRRAPGSTCT